MYEHRSIGQQISDVVLITVLLYVVVQLFKRRLGWFAEKLIGFVFFSLLGMLIVYVVANQVGAVTPDPVTGSDSFAPGWVGAEKTVGIGFGIFWVIYSGFTWKESHRLAMIKYEADKRARKQRRQARVAQFRNDYWA